ncbi:Chitosanase [Penicillium ucsense]|uniref:Endo-chitosanase n=1 Tax=Penicillium ucsense TaxID=2839758 RepID=A0A8J8W0W1_9EURO|nr:Chitosanase [Penicillium ucsense]KAF7733484.1 Chitosanase [Penicillium ucsense]
MHATGVLLLVLVGLVPAYELPPHLKELYQQHEGGKCNNVLQSGFSDGESGKADIAYCGDIHDAIFLHTQSSKGAYADMDIDHDGADNSAGECSNDPSGQGQTAFQDEVKKLGISDLNANVHPYVVFGNEGGNPTFDPQRYGMEPLSVMAVICNGELHYGIWGDTNGGHLVGEASLSMAKLCFPEEHLNGNSGHETKDVMYIGFGGKNAVPGKSANWHAVDGQAFENSLKPIGDSLVAKLSASLKGSSTPTPGNGSKSAFASFKTTPTPTPTSEKSNTSIARRGKYRSTKDKTRDHRGDHRSTKDESRDRRNYSATSGYYFTSTPATHTPSHRPSHISRPITGSAPVSSHTPAKTPAATPSSTGTPSFTRVPSSRRRFV